LRLLLLAVCLIAWGAAWAAADAPVPAAFDPVAAADAYLAQPSPGEQASFDAYTAGKHWLVLWDFVVLALSCLLLLETRAAARLRDALERVIRYAPVRSGLYATLFMVLIAVLGFPLSAYEDFFREHQYEMSNLTFPGWLREFATAWGVQVATLAPVAVAMYYAMQRAPRSWHRWATGIAVAYLAFSNAIAPVFVAPLFNRYEPLAESPFKRGILSMAHASGMAVDEVYQFDASKQSSRISANVSGLLGTTRIALSDNLLRALTPAGVKAVVGHELGHYVLNHIAINVIFNGLLFALGLAFARWGVRRLLAWRGERWRVHEERNLAAMPALVLLLAAWLFLTTPLSNTLTRSEETEADVFGLNAAQEPDGFAEVIVLLGEALGPEPGALEKFVFFDHPTGRGRVLQAMRWKAEHL
jgi:STE24 endopeptidase